MCLCTYIYIYMYIYIYIYIYMYIKALLNKLLRMDNEGIRDRLLRENLTPVEARSSELRK